MTERERPLLVIEPSRPIIYHDTVRTLSAQAFEVLRLVMPL